MTTPTIFVFVFEIGVWALLASIAMGALATARSGGETPTGPRVLTRVLFVIVVLAAVVIGLTIGSGDANPLIFEYASLLGVGALVGHDAKARGEWTWKARIHGCFAVLAVICAIGGRYIVTASFALSDGTGSWAWITLVAALVLGVGPLVAYAFARGPRLDGLTPAVTFVKGVMGASAEGAAMALPRYIIGFIIIAGILINGANVIGRYVYLAPIIWAEEIMIYGMVWTVFIGAVLVTWDGRHLRMDLVSTSLPSPWKEILNGVGVAAFLAVCIFILPQDWAVVSKMYQFDQRSVVAEIPMAIPHFALLFGFTMMFVAILVRVRRQITGEMESELDDLVAGEGEAAPGSASDR